MSDYNEQEKQWSRIVAKAWADEGYKARLLSEPAALLAEEGVEIDNTLEYKVVETSANQVVLVLPPQPAPSEAAVAGEERRSAFLFGKRRPYYIS